MTWVGDTGRALEMASRNVNDAVAIWLNTACASSSPIVAETLCNKTEGTKGEVGIVSINTTVGYFVHKRREEAGRSLGHFISMRLVPKKPRCFI